MNITSFGFKFLSISTAALCLSLTACQPKSTDPNEISKENAATATGDKITKIVKIDRNPTKNAYFGDTHVHTKNSFDAFIVGTRTTADDAYRFAKGEAIDNGEGHQIKLGGPPLDFYAVTDHGEYMGIIAAMRDKTLISPKQIRPNLSSDFLEAHAQTV